MTANHSSVPARSREQETRKLFLTAGTAYGLIFGLSFSLFTWGFDALSLASSGADLAGAKLILGLPLAMVICGLAGRLAASSSSMAVFIALGAVVGALLGVIAGHMPYDGSNLAAWLADRRLWGLVVFPYGHAAAVRTTLVAIVMAGLGAVVGFVEYLAVEWAWDRATPEGRMSVLSWILLLACIPPVLLMTGTVEEMINQPIRTPQQRVGELIGLALEGAVEEAQARGLTYRAVEPFLASFSEQYVVHLVDYDQDTLYSAYVDVAFDNGFVLRCATVGKTVVHCDDFSRKFADWMDDLVHAGLHDERRWLDARVRYLAVDDAVVAWLADHRDQLSAGYELTWAGQQGGCVFMSARFDSGFEMTCRFLGAAPVRVDQCVEGE